MRFLTLFPLLAYLVSAAPNAVTPPERFQKAHDAILGSGDSSGAIPGQSAAPGDKSAGRIDQFRGLWKERGQRNAPKKQQPPPSKMDKLVSNAGERQTNKKGSPPSPPAGQKKGPSSPPPSKKGSSAPQKPKAKKKAAALERREIEKAAAGPAQQCRGPASPVPLEGNAKHANPQAFFRFAEQTLGTRYTPQQLAAAKRRLEDSLERQKKQGDGTDSADDEFLRFAGLTAEQVAPPPPTARGVVQAEAKNAGLDGLARSKREAVKQDGAAGAGAAGRTPRVYDRPNYANRAAYDDDDDYSDWPDPAYPDRAYRGPPPSYYRAGPCRDEREKTDEAFQTDIDINTDESKTLVMIFEDVKRYIVLYNANCAEGILVSTDGDVNLDLGLVDAARSPAGAGEHDRGSRPDPYEPRPVRHHGQWPAKAVVEPGDGLSAAELDELVRRLGSARSAAAAVGADDDYPFFYSSGDDDDPHDDYYYAAQLAGAKAKAAAATPVPVPESAEPGPESAKPGPESAKPGPESAKPGPEGQGSSSKGDKPGSERPAAQPPKPSDAQLRRESFDAHARERGPWCPISDQQVLRVLEAMV